jgi:hypothetical protein
VLARRRAWFKGQPDLDPERLVFIDETGASTKMARLRGRAKRGTRCRSPIPHGHWKTTTFTGALRMTGLTAPMVLDGPMTGERFATYAQQVLGPTLRPGDIVILDNLPAHKVAAAREARGVIELRDSRGWQHTFVPLRLGATGDSQAVQLHERKPLTLYTGDTIRWTANDHQRGLINAYKATITAITPDSVTVGTSTGVEQALKSDDPMLARIDLAYALNAHMAQGLTSDKGIAVMDSRTHKLLSARNFLVTIIHPISSIRGCAGFATGVFQRRP